MRTHALLLAHLILVASGCETALEGAPPEPEAVATPELVGCDGLLTAASVRDVCGVELEVELIPNQGYCNIVVGGGAPLNNLKITVAEARAKPPSLLHGEASEDLESFETLDLAVRGSQWTQYQRSVGTYSHNVELITSKHWVHLRHSTWSDEPSMLGASCGLAEMRTLARLIAAKLEAREGTEASP